MIGGRVVLRLNREFLTKLAAGKRIAVVTGTNGKTTTTRMLSEAIQATGAQVASNRGGDNMTPGITAALMSQPDAPFAVLEVDEMHLAEVCKMVRPEVIVLLNLSRDQLDRVGEIATIEKRVRQAVIENPKTKLVVNIDDPLMTSAALSSDRAIWVAAGKGWTKDSLTAPRSGGAIIYGHNRGDEPALASGGDTLVQWYEVSLTTLFSGKEEAQKYSGSGFSRPVPVWTWQGTDFQVGGEMVVQHHPKDEKYKLAVNLPGRANRSNALQAFVAALELSVEPSQAARGIAQVSEVVGRYAHLEITGRQIRMLLAKNPAGWMESMSMLDPEAQLIVGVNGQRADGMDLSWLWDVNFEALQGKTVVATGQRGADLQVRLNYAGIQTRWAENVAQAIEEVAPGKVDMLLNYTCFRDVRNDFIAKGYMQ